MGGRKEIQSEDVGGDGNYYLPASGGAIVGGARSGPDPPLRLREALVPTLETLISNLQLTLFALRLMPWC